MFMLIFKYILAALLLICSIIFVIIANLIFYKIILMEIPNLIPDFIYFLIFSVAAIFFIIGALKQIKVK